MTQFRRFVMVCWMGACALEEGELEELNTGGDGGDASPDLAEPDPRSTAPDGGEEPNEEPKDELTVAPGAEDLEGAQVVELGELEGGSVSEMGDGGLRSSFAGQSWIPIGTGVSAFLYVNLTAGQNLDARAQPSSGDIDLYVWRGATLVGSSVRVAGWVDTVTTSTASPTGQYTVELRCYAGPCAFSSTVSVGDTAGMELGRLSYLNQRSFTARTAGHTCTSSTGAVIADGECMCADTSAAVAAVDGGHTPIANARAAAQDLYVNTNSPTTGAALRANLMARLDANYGYASCSEISATAANVVNEIRAGRLLLLRSSAFSGSGHYVRIYGYTASGNTLLADDPYGAWSSRNVWSPLNTTAQSSTSGRARLYSLATLAPGGTLITCR